MKLDLKTHSINSALTATVTIILLSAENNNIEQGTSLSHTQILNQAFLSHFVSAISFFYLQTEYLLWQEML